MHEHVLEDLGLSEFLDMVSWISYGLASASHYALFLSAIVILIFTLIFWAVGGLPKEGKPANADVFDPCLSISAIFAFTDSA